MTEASQLGSRILSGPESRRARHKREVGPQDQSGAGHLADLVSGLCPHPAVQQGFTHTSGSLLDFSPWLMGLGGHRAYLVSVN